jgi:putative PIN family toxin of toxin-antitoxin system
MPPAPRSRIVIDTNVLISRFLKRNSVPAQAVAKAARSSVVLVSTATFAEVETVFQRRKFDSFFTLARRREMLDEFRILASFVPIPTPIRACRDPRDDKFLEVAVHGRADLILTGDADLLALHPFRGIAILTPAEYLELT